MAQTAELRGRASVRPFRVGLLVDTTSTTEVADAFFKLSTVWGGCYMPIFDRNRPTDELVQLAQFFDVDALTAEDGEGDLGHFLQESRWGWGRYGDHGAFADLESLRPGLLLAQDVVIDGGDPLVAPTWADSDPLSLLYSALWGQWNDNHRAQDRFVKLSVDLLFERLDLHESKVGILREGCANVIVAPRAYMESVGGVYVARAGHPEDSASPRTWEPHECEPCYPPWRRCRS